MKNRESEEMYLETILLLQQKSAEVRSVEVAERLGFAKSSVSVAVHLLEQKGYLTIGPGGLIRLTEEGAARAEAIYERHRILTELFMRFGADRQLAEDNACRIEHIISPELFDLIRNSVRQPDKS